MSGEPRKGLALILEGKPKDDDEGAKSLGDGELEAMQVFEKAKTSEAKAAALKDFIKLCTSA